MTRRTLRAALAAAAVGAGSLAAAGPVAAAPDPITPVEWQRTVLTTEVQDPTDLDVAPDGTVVIAERTGAVKVWRQDGTLKTAGTVPVSANVSLTEVGEDDLEEGGIHGLLLDRRFAQTRRVFIHYSVPGSVDDRTGLGLFRTSTFVLRKDWTLDLKSEKVIMRVPAEWEHCCHYGGDLEWMADGTLLLTTGDDTSPREEGWNPRDKRKDREAFNAERTAQNKRDLRGKLLRFNPDGSVPRNNPHVGNRAYTPYVFAMGFRSDYRMGHDPKTGATFVGNVGPDARTADETRGPQGFDELEIVPRRGGTNHGWPRCIANNLPYKDYDYATAQTKGTLSCQGMTPAALAYTYDPSAEYPVLGAGQRTQMAGPVYRYTGTGALRLPDWFQGKLIHWDWSRSVVFATPVRANGTLDLASMTPWSAATPNTFVGAGTAVPAGGPTAPNEIVVGPDGALYVAEYGSGYYENSNSAISRITCFACTPSAADYGGASVDPAAGVTSPVDRGAGVAAASTSGLRSALGDLPSAAVLLGGLGALVVLLRALRTRRRAPRVADASGI